MKKHPLIERADHEPATWLGLVSFLLWVAMVGIPIIYTLPISGWYHDAPFVVTTSWLWRAFLAMVDEGNTHLIPPLRAIATIPRYCTFLSAVDLVHSFLMRSAPVFGGGCLAMYTTRSYLLRRTPLYPDVSHISGRRLWRIYDGISYTRRALAGQRAATGTGVELAPSIFLPIRMEVLHKLVLGAVGSGKTMIFRWLIERYLARGARIVIHDSKGEYAEGLPRDDFVLLAPHHEESWAWDVGSDINGEQSAREFAGKIIPMSHDPMWATAAREIFTGLVVSLIGEKNTEWGWTDLYEALFEDIDTILTKLECHYPLAALFIERDGDSGALTKTSLGILITAWAAAAAIVRPLALAWGKAPKTRRFSLRKWLHDPKSDRILILQRSAEFAFLSTAWIGAAVDLMGSHIASPNCPDSDERLVFALDELVQLGQLQSLPQIIEVGRSKGAVVIIGAQDHEQLRRVYGEATVASWMSMIGIKIILRINAGDSASWVCSSLIGSRDVAWYEESTTYSKQGKQISVQRQRTTVPVVSPADLEIKLGLVNTAEGIRVRGLLLGIGDVLEIDWYPVTWKTRRPAVRPAKWLTEHHRRLGRH